MSIMRPEIAIATLWAIWLLSWLAAARWTGRTEKRPGIAQEAPYRIATVMGALLMFLPPRGFEGAVRLWSMGRTGAWSCVALVAAGMAIAWWARLYLGPLWSSNVTRKAEHRVVDTGPYAVVRHPIYSGLLLSLVATAVAMGTALALAGFAAMALGIWMKARVEEKWLLQELGAQAYGTYRKRVPMLIPLGPKG